MTKLGEEHVLEMGKWTLITDGDWIDLLIIQENICQKYNLTRSIFRNKLEILYKNNYNEIYLESGIIKTYYRESENIFDNKVSEETILQFQKPYQI